MLIPLDPTKIRSRQEYNNKTPEQAFIHCGIKPLLRDALFKLFLGDGDFTIDLVKEQIDRILYNELPTVINDTVTVELYDVRVSRSASSPFTDLLVNLPALDKEEWDISDLLDASLPKEFEDGLQGAFKGLDGVVKIFQAVREDEALLKFLREVAALSDSAEETGVAPLYRRALSALEDSDIKIASSDLLYFLTFVPLTVRVAVQDVLLFKRDADYLEDAKRAITDETSIKFIDEFTSFLKSSIFLDPHWTDLSRWYGESEELSEHQIQLGVSNIGHLSHIISSCEDPDIRSIFDGYMAFTQDMYNHIAELDRSIQPLFWQCIDTAHCFRLEDYHLTNLKYNGRFTIGAPKNGQTAVILEDSQNQMKNWATLVDSYSQYSLLQDGKSLCTIPEEVLQHVDDTNVGLYLLDIQNGDDSTAGIRIAEQLLKALSERLSSDADDQDVTVVVWSSSEASLNIADTVLAAFLQANELKDLSTYFFSQGSNSGSYSLTLRIQHKRECPF